MMAFNILFTFSKVLISLKNLFLGEDYKDKKLDQLDKGLEIENKSDIWLTLFQFLFII